MRLKIEFKYQCELDVKDEEIDDLKKNFKKDVIVQWLSNGINKFFLVDDGRFETGGIVDFDYEIEED